ncbi:MAG TPA: hypothetical protein VHX66_08985 [Solirubrobacteraceae bacterium]|jgi:hypothetical protein|nr:hypothetical protein [Solirubrobacteraceae bacterium]
MPPTDHQIPSNVAEPPQEGPPDGRWADRLRAEFLAAAQDLDEVGEPGELSFFPDRTWHGYTYIPVAGMTSTSMQLYGYVRFVAATDGRDQGDFSAYADFTDETAERNPDWKLDLCDEVVGSWRGVDDAVASMTLVWGQSLVSGGATATAELGGQTVDQCTLVADRFTLLAPDDYAGALLEVRLYSQAGEELARESLYDDDE